MDSATQSKLGNALLKNLIGLREKKGQILIEDVGAILDGMAGSIVGEDASHKFLRDEIEKMAKYIMDARAELVQLIPNPEEGAPKNINAASLELGEVVKATEEATNQIMDTADKINEIAGKMDDKELAGELMNAGNSLYDACSFQDITGQRVNKSIRTLENIEARVFALVELFGGDVPEGYAPPEGTERVERPDEELMSGPQMTGDMPSQEDIDNLFDSI
ncbi:MAG: hypothetical protein MRY32_02005 [Rickettsiales bacterium]|nr:hypothetical protein [Rickettsiales bacterium]